MISDALAFNGMTGGGESGGSHALLIILAVLIGLWLANRTLRKWLGLGREQATLGDFQDE